jgi:hypothetical protein
MDPATSQIANSGATKLLLFGLEVRDWVSIAAIIIGPVFAVLASMWLSKRSQKRERKINLFRTLMSTRAKTISPEHVEALNMIDLTFYGDKKVIAAWKLYSDHLNTRTDTEEEKKAWIATTPQLLNALLLTMSSELGFDIDLLTIKKDAYSPVAHENRLCQLSGCKSSGQVKRPGLVSPFGWCGL